MQTMPRSMVYAWLLAGIMSLPLAAQQSDVPSAEGEQPDKPAAAPLKLQGLTRLSEEYDIWIDAKRKLVVVDGTVCLREGPLEMFACSKGTKEHESVVAVNSPARFVHAALLAVGAKVGNTVRFSPEYRPASGTTIDVWVLWKDKDGMNRKVKAQEWIKNFKTDKAMAYDWVFAGSGFTVDEETGERFYHADGGDFICVSNFSTATLDLPVKSSQDTSDLLFAAYTERIPALKTHIRLVLAPRVEKAKSQGSGDSSDAKPDSPQK